MKVRHSQAGSAHLVIIIVLAILLLGVLGFVFWQNFMNKPATTTKTDNTTQSVSTDTSSKDKTLSVTEWGVKGTYQSDTTYGYAIDQYGLLHFTDPKLSAACSQELSDISRATANELPILSGTGNSLTAQEVYDQQTNQGPAAHVGDYYYFFVHAQSACDTDAETTIQGDIGTSESEFVSSLTAL